MYKKIHDLPHHVKFQLDDREYTLDRNGGFNMVVWDEDGVLKATNYLDSQILTLFNLDDITILEIYQQ